MTDPDPRPFHERVAHSIQHDENERPLPLIDVRRMWDELERVLGRRIW